MTGDGEYERSGFAQAKSWRAGWPLVIKWAIAHGKRRPTAQHAHLQSSMAYWSKTARNVKNRTFQESSGWIIDELERRGIRLDPSTRLARYAAQFVKNAYGASLTPVDNERAIEESMAIRDLQEIQIILEEFPSASRESIESLIKDSIAPRLDCATPGRDRQLELFIGAVCQRGGFNVRLDREPDLWCQVSRVWLSLAVKRVRSAKKFAENLKKAGDQVQKSSLRYGLVLMDISLAWNPRLAIIRTSRSGDDVAFDNAERLSRYLDGHKRLLNETWDRYPKCLGLICIDSTIVQQSAAGWFRDQFNMLVPSSRQDGVRQKLMIAFQNGWERGVPNCENMNDRPRTHRFAGPPVDKIMALR